jgi:hypothetical protein
MYIPRNWKLAQLCPNVRISLPGAGGGVEPPNPPRYAIGDDSQKVLSVKCFSVHTITVAMQRSCRYLATDSSMTGSDVTDSTASVNGSLSVAENTR